MSSAWIFKALSLFIVVAATAGAQIRVRAEDESVRLAIEDYATKTLQGEFNADQVSDFIRSSYFRWPIYSIRVLSSSPSLKDLEFDVVLKRQLVGINIRGNRSLRDKHLLAALSLREGDYLLPMSVQALKEKLEQYYLRRGFPDRSISVNLLDRGQGRSELLINIEEGKPCQLLEVEFLGERIKDFSGKRCDLQRLEDWVEKQSSRLKASGYLMARILDPVVLYRDQSHRALVRIEGRKGPKVDVVFRGNTFAFERNDLLTESMYLKNETGLSTSFLEFTAREGILTFYREKGYPQATVDIKDVWGEGAQTRRIEFVIQRGEKVKFHLDPFKGLTQISQTELRRAFNDYAPALLRRRTFVLSELDRMSAALRGYLESRGYLHAQVSPPQVTLDPKRADRRRVTFEIEEGEQTILEAVRILGLESHEERRVSALIKPPLKRPLDPQWLRRAYLVIEDHFQRRGYKYVTVELPALASVASGRVSLDIKIIKGPRVKIGEIIVIGNVSTRPKVVTQELTFEKGDMHHPAEVRDSRRRLLQKGYFESVSLESLPTHGQNGVEDMIVTVQERKKRSLILRPGFSTDDGARAAAELRYLNMFGTGRDLSMGAKLNRRVEEGSIWERRISLTYVEPYIVEKIRFRTTLVDEVLDDQQFDLRRSSVTLALERLFSIRYRGALEWGLEFRDPFNIDLGAILSPIDQSAARFGSIGASADIDFRDDLLNPTRGSIHRVQYHIYDSRLFSQADFQQVFLRNTFYQPLYKRLRAVLAVRLGFSSTYGGTRDEGVLDIPIEKRFRLGGANSFRGVQLNCIGGLPSDVPENCSDSILSQAPGGNSVFNYMFELLVPLASSIDIALFTDGGNAYARNSDFNPLNIRNSAGAGLRINTFFGPLRFDYGVLLDRRQGEPLGTFHFSVGQF